MNWFRKNRPKETSCSPSNEISAKGILVFHQTSDVILAESVLKQAGMAIQVMGPPPNLSTGCDLVIVFPLISELAVHRILADADIQPVQTVPVHDTLLLPVSLFQTRDYGEYLMVRAANMKLTIHRSSRQIVNISGGGCPDVPWLADQLIGKTLDTTTPPNRLGKTLCGYALHLAWEEMHRQCPG
ncbi:MAG: DUF3343 domain-containing protein [Desulfatirhabdiaceae bacterium]